MEPNNMQRTFLSVLLTHDEQKQVSTLIKQAQSACQNPAWCWQAPHQLHLTLVFIGALSKLSFHTLKTQLTNDLKHVQAFDYKINSVHCWHQRQYELLIAGITNCTALHGLQDTLEQRCQNNHILSQQEQTFVPHITLAKKPHDQQSSTYKAAASITLHASRVHLMHSQNHQYQPLAQWTLS